MQGSDSDSKRPKQQVSLSAESRIFGALPKPNIQTKLNIRPKKVFVHPYLLAGCSQVFWANWAIVISEKGHLRTC
jgi:hypothetical protein